MMSLHCFSVCFMIFLYCCVGFLFIFMRWLSCINFCILWLYSSFVNINNVFPLSAYVMIILFVSILFLFFIFIICFHSSLVFLLFILLFLLISFIFFSQLHAYSNFVCLCQDWLLLSRLRGLTFQSICCFYSVNYILIIYPMKLNRNYFKKNKFNVCQWSRTTV
jgi:hypothetical protein